MAGRGKNRQSGNKPSTSTIVEDEATTSLSLAGDSPILSVFLKAASRLTERQNRHEALVKQSRDLTIESKRIIFLLHSAITKENTKEKVIAEAKERFGKLINGPIKTIAIETDKAPAYLHYRAITAGLQEFVEARTLLSIIEQNVIISFAELSNELTFRIKSVDGSEQDLPAPLLPVDYILGVADLTGELMRKGISAIAGGNPDECLFACDIVRRLYAGFLGVYGGNQVLNNKLKATRANVYKVEHALFTYYVRGREAIPKMRLAPPPPARQSDVEEDQGCY